MPAPKRALEGAVPRVGPSGRAAHAAPLVLGPSDRLRAPLGAAKWSGGSASGIEPVVEPTEASEHLALAAAALSQSYDECAKLRRALSRACRELHRCPPDAMRDEMARIDALHERLASLEPLGDGWGGRGSRSTARAPASPHHSPDTTTNALRR